MVDGTFTAEIATLHSVMDRAASQLDVLHKTLQAAR